MAWCFGGAFQLLIGATVAVAADDPATFGLSEINWGNTSLRHPRRSRCRSGWGQRRRASTTFNDREEQFDGKRAQGAGAWSTISVPREELRERTRQLEHAQGEEPLRLRSAKTAYHHVKSMSWDAALTNLMAKSDQTKFRDPEKATRRA